MTTANNDDAATWRDLADQLTDDQLARIEHMEATPSPFNADETKAILLRAGRECIADTGDGALTDAEMAAPPRPCGIPRAAVFKARSE
jgi:hypothetical protein